LLFVVFALVYTVVAVALINVVLHVSTDSRALGTSTGKIKKVRRFRLSCSRLGKTYAGHFPNHSRF